MATKKTALVNPVKTFSTVTATAAATSYKAVGRLIDQATLEADNQRTILWSEIKDDFLRNFEEGSVFGNYQIPLEEGEIVEVPLQAGPEALTEEELAPLGALSSAVFDALLERVEVIDSVSDAPAFRAHLSSLDDATFSKLISVTSKKVSVSIAAPKGGAKIPGVSYAMATVPKTDFVARLKQALSEPHAADDEKILSIWLKDRIKGQVKIGNRAKEETT
jgi:hypothetical protein